MGKTKKQLELPKSKTVDDVISNAKERGYFELELIGHATKAFSTKDYLKSAMLSWSFIEEYFLPRTIKHIANRQKIKLDGSFYESSASTLIKYLYLISYDQELFIVMQKTRKKVPDLYAQPIHIY